jgi:hypothetical protein
MGFGSYCMKATAVIHHDDGSQNEWGRVVGYDTDFTITENTEIACRLHIKRRKNLKCNAASLTLLPGTKTECSGQIYFMFDSTLKRLV